MDTLLNLATGLGVLVMTAMMLVTVVTFYMAVVQVLAERRAKMEYVERVLKERLEREQMQANYRHMKAQQAHAHEQFDKANGYNHDFTD